MSSCRLTSRVFSLTWIWLQTDFLSCFLCCVLLLLQFRFSVVVDCSCGGPPLFLAVLHGPPCANGFNFFAAIVLCRPSGRPSGWRFWHDISGSSLTIFCQGSRRSLLPVRARHHSACPCALTLTPPPPPPSRRSGRFNLGPSPTFAGSCTPRFRLAEPSVPPSLGRGGGRRAAHAGTGGRAPRPARPTISPPGRREPPLPRRETGALARANGAGERPTCRGAPAPRRPRAQGARTRLDRVSSPPSSRRARAPPVPRSAHHPALSRAGAVASGEPRSSSYAVSPARVSMAAAHPPPPRRRHGMATAMAPWPHRRHPHGHAPTCAATACPMAPTAPIRPRPRPWPTACLGLGAASGGPRGGGGGHGLDGLRPRCRRRRRRPRSARRAKEREASLAQANARVDAALNNMTQGLCMFDAQEKLVVCNERYLKMYDLPADIVKPGCSLAEILELRKEAGNFSADIDTYLVGSAPPIRAWRICLHDHASRRRPRDRAAEPGGARRRLGRDARGHHRAPARGSAHRAHGTA